MKTTFSSEKYDELKIKKGVTDYEVMMRTGVPASTLSCWRNHRYTPKVDKIKKIADYFGVSVEFFLDDRG